jgi:hypothetical protein
VGEGVAAYQPRVKIAAYEIAKKEATKVHAIVRRLITKKLLADREIERAYGLAGAIIGMLTKAIIRLSSRA